jgi:subtilisin-like proprotein convertase family protein
MKALQSTFVILVMLIPFSLFGQILDASNNISAQNVNLTKQINQTQPNPVRIGNENADEYGTGSANDFLGGLGSTGGYMAVPDASGIYNLTSAGTVEAWIMPTATTSSAPAVIAKGDVTNVNFLMYWQASSSLMGFRIGNTATTNTGGTTAPLNQWTHVAVTWTGSAGSYTVTFYINGALSGATVTNAGTFNAATFADSLTIGSSRSGFSGVTFYGYIDEVKIWNTVRTQSQIAQSRFVGLGDYASANTGNAITSAVNYTGLLSSWTFNNHFRDDIGGKLGYARKDAGLYWYGYTGGYPIPYNYALYCQPAGGTNDYVTIPENTVFDQTSAGTFEAWIYLNAASTLQPIFHKGNAFATTTLAAYVSAGNKFGINIGAHNYISTGPATFVANKWYHVAATWTGGPNFTVNLYVNGQFDYTATYNLAMPTATGPAWIGRYYNTTRFNGYIDEIRYWSGARTQYQIQQGMFASCRSLLPNANLVGAWNFDGNLKNFSATTGIDASFNSGGTNNCRISGYSNEATTGPAPNEQFISHNTVINCTAFPLGYNRKVPIASIPDNSSLTDTIKISGNSGNLTDLKVFLSIQHQKTSDLVIKLKAPNSTEIVLSNGNGGNSANGYLTCFDDSASYTITSATYLSPWAAHIKPQNAMGTFGSTPLNGNWVLTVTDGAASNTGTLLGWGLRFNGSTIVGYQNISSNVPDKFELSQNYPNPFNPVTKIKYQVPSSEYVKLVVYDILGREVKTLVNSKLEAGIYEYEFDGSNLNSGVYFYKLQTGNYTNVKKMMLIK